MKTDYTREELVAICEKSAVAEKDWRDRDSSDAQRQLGEAAAVPVTKARFG